MNDNYKKLVDLYAGQELPEEIEREMEAAALSDNDLNFEMKSMRQTVVALRTEAAPDFTEESYQRVLMKLYARAGDIQAKAPTPTHLQYHLPMQG